MARTKGGPRAHARHRKVIKAAKGYYGRRKNCFRTAVQAVEKAGQYAYRDRRTKKRNFRALWIQRINAASRELGMPYSQFMAGVTKAGIHGLTVWLAGYWAKRQATVNTIAPGAVFNGHSDEFQRRVSELIMADRMAEPDEIADMAVFLASPGSAMVSGQAMSVDGHTETYHSE